MAANGLAGEGNSLNDMSPITVRAHYNRAKRVLFLEDDLPEIESDPLTVRIQFVSTSHEESENEDFFNALHAAYGAASELAEGVSYARKIRDNSDKRVKALWR